MGWRGYEAMMMCLNFAQLSIQNYDKSFDFKFCSNYFKVGSMDSMESAEKSYSDMFRERDNYGEDFNSANIDLVGKLRRQSNVEGGLADLKLQTFFTPQQITRASSIMTRRSSSVMTRRSSFDRAMTQLSSLKKKMRDSMGSSTKYGYGINTDSVLKAVQELCHVRTSDRLEIHTMLQASASHFRMINRPTKDKESVKEPEECEDEKQQKQNILEAFDATQRMNILDKLVNQISENSA